MVATAIWLNNIINLAHRIFCLTSLEKKTKIRYIVFTIHSTQFMTKSQSILSSSGRSSAQDLQTLAIPKTNDKLSRKLVLNTSIFLLGKDSLKQIYWSVTSCKYTVDKNHLNVGIKTIDGKTGTVLKNMRAFSTDLAEFLKAQRVLPRVAKVTFFIDKDREKDYLEKLNDLIDSVELGLNVNIDS